MDVVLELGANMSKDTGIEDWYVFISGGKPIDFCLTSSWKAREKAAYLSTLHDKKVNYGVFDAYNTVVPGGSDCRLLRWLAEFEQDTPPGYYDDTRSHQIPIFAKTEEEAIAVGGCVLMAILWQKTGRNPGSLQFSDISLLDPLDEFEIDPDSDEMEYFGNVSPEEADAEVREAEALVHRLRSHMKIETPKIVCLCGSTKFKEAFEDAAKKEGTEGKIVLTITSLNRDYNEKISDEQKAHLDELHRRRIDLASEVLVLNVDGYIGDSTADEISYALLTGKPIRFLEERKNFANLDSWAAKVYRNDLVLEDKIEESQVRQSPKTNFIPSEGWLEWKERDRG